MKKKKQQKKHAKSRFAQRLSVNLTQNMHDDLVKQIQKNKLQFVEKQSNRITVFQTMLEGEKVNLVYDKQRKNIVTVLYVNKEEHDIWSKL